MASRRKPLTRSKTHNSNASSGSQHSESTDSLLNRSSVSESLATYHTAEVDQHNTRPSSSADPFGNVSSTIEGYSNAAPHHYSTPSPTSYRPYQPGQYLEPIITGETLQLTAEAKHAESFADPNLLSTASTPGAVTPTDFYYNHPNQPYPAYHQNPAVGTELEHFHHDTEAYASGLQSGATYRPPRSRSPTPAVDEEDYYVVGDQSIHHIGYPTSGHSGDSEKTALRQGQDDKDMRYYSERGYLPDGQAVVFDPEPETPASTLYSLPPETPLETRHFGPAPTGRVLRRHKTKRRVQLTNGNLVVDLDVPPKLVLPWRGTPEMMTTRYTAVTCDPDEFEKNGFFLRQNESGRRTELFIVITMYNVGAIVS